MSGNDRRVARQDGLRDTGGTPGHDHESGAAWLDQFTPGGVMTRGQGEFEQTLGFVSQPGHLRVGGGQSASPINDMNGSQGPGMQTHQIVDSLHDWRANKGACSGTRSVAAADPATGANASVTVRERGTPPLTVTTKRGADGVAARSTPATSRSRFDPSCMPAPSPSVKRFMEVMSGDEDDPAFAVSAALFFWRFSRRGMPMPKGVMALLDRHASAGDPNCILVRDWLKKKMVKTGKRTLWAFEGGRA